VEFLTSSSVDSERRSSWHFWVISKSNSETADRGLLDSVWTYIFLTGWVEKKKTITRKFIIITTYQRFNVRTKLCIHNYFNPVKWIIKVRLGLDHKGKDKTQTYPWKQCYAHWKLLWGKLLFIFIYKHSPHKVQCVKYHPISALSVTHC